MAADLVGIAAVISSLTSFGAMVTSGIVALRQNRNKISTDTKLQAVERKLDNAVVIQASNPLYEEGKNPNAQTPMGKGGEQRATEDRPGSRDSRGQ